MKWSKTPQGVFIKSAAFHFLMTSPNQNLIGFFSSLFSVRNNPEVMLHTYLASFHSLSAMQPLYLLGQGWEIIQSFSVVLYHNDISVFLFYKIILSYLMTQANKNKLCYADNS